MTFSDLIRNFFTNKDFLPPADQIPGTMWTPLHLVFAAIVAVIIACLVIFLRKKSEKTLKIVFTCLWATLVVLEIVKISWETLSSRVVAFEWDGNLPLYPCSMFMFFTPLAIWGKNYVRKAGCGYVCTVGLIGGLINFVYPATILGNYSCISFAGFHTFFYHGTMVLTALTMLLSGYHSYNHAHKWWETLIAFLPCLVFSIPVNIVNFTIGSDYMFFKCNSFFLAPIGAALPDWLTVIIMYAVYALAHSVFYLPGYLKNRLASKKTEQ